MCAHWRHAGTRPSTPTRGGASCCRTAARYGGRTLSRHCWPTEDADILFIAGCEQNQVQFHPQFDHIILLSAPPGTLAERLAARTSNVFGKKPEELRRVLDDVQTVEPLLRRVADHEVRTMVPLDEVVTTVLRLVGA